MFVYTFAMRCAIWFHLYNLKNVKNTHGGVLLLVKLQAFVIEKIDNLNKMGNLDNSCKNL